MSLERWSQTAQSLMLIESLTASQRDVVTLVRLWHTDVDGKQTVWQTLYDELGPPRARVALRALEKGLSLIARNGPKPLKLRPAGDELVTQDEKLLAELVDQALSPDREQALLSAMLLVRPDLAPTLLENMTQLSLHLRCCGRLSPRVGLEHSARTLH